MKASRLKPVLRRHFLVSRSTARSQTKPVMSRDSKFPSAESDRPVHKVFPDCRAFPDPPGRPAPSEALAQLDRLVRRERKDYKALLALPGRNGFPLPGPPYKTLALFWIITLM